MEFSNELETKFRTFEALMNDTSRLIRTITVEVGVPDEAVALAVRVLDDFKFTEKIGRKPTVLTVG